MSRLEGKVAMVTGASKGIGAGIAKGLAAAGASVAVNYASDRSSAAAVVAAITAAGGRAIVAPQAPRKVRTAQGNAPVKRRGMPPCRRH